MLYTKDLSKLIITSTIALSCALFTSASFAEEEAQAPSTTVDPLTGEITEAPQLLSNMSEEEKAKLSDEEIKALEDLEASLERNSETTQY